MEPAIIRTRATATAMGLSEASPAPQMSYNAPSCKTNTRTNKSRLTQPTVSSRSKTRTGNAEAVEAQNSRQIMRRMTKNVAKIENEVHQTMAVMDAETVKLLNHRQLRRDPKYSKEWKKSSANKFERLANGVGGKVKGTNTIKFIKRSDMPSDRRKDVTYGQFVCSVRLEKKEQNRTRFVVGGDRINYLGEVATPTACMLVAKLIFNSVVSTKGAKFMTMDI